MKYKLILLCLALILVMGLTSAAEDDQILTSGKAGQQIVFLCDNAGALCPATTTCNVTLYYPDDTPFLENQIATRQGPEKFTYNLTQAQTLTLGPYSGIAFCRDGTINSKPTPFTFQISSSGDSNSQNFWIFILLAGSSVIILAIGIISQNEYIGFISGALFIVTGVYSMIYGINGVVNLYTRSIAYVALGLGLLFFIASAWKLGSWGGEDDE